MCKLSRRKKPQTKPSISDQIIFLALATATTVALALGYRSLVENAPALPKFSEDPGNPHSKLNLEYEWREQRYIVIQEEFRAAVKDSRLLDIVASLADKAGLGEHERR